MSESARNRKIELRFSASSPYPGRLNQKRIKKHQPKQATITICARYSLFSSLCQWYNAIHSYNDMIVIRIWHQKCILNNAWLKWSLFSFFQKDHFEIQLLLCAQFKRSCDHATAIQRVYGERRTLPDQRRQFRNWSIFGISIFVVQASCHSLEFQCLAVGHWMFMFFHWIAWLMVSIAVCDKHENYGHLLSANKNRINFSIQHFISWFCDSQTR